MFYDCRQCLRGDALTQLNCIIDLCSQAYMQGVGSRGRAVHSDALSVNWRRLIVNHSPEESFSGNGPVVSIEIPCPLPRNQI